MDLEIVYPKPKSVSLLMHRLRKIFGLLFLLAAPSCVLVNYLTGGKAWSAVAIWGMYMVWTLALKQPLVEKNVISQGVRLLITTGIMLILIETFLYPGWAHFVVPIFWFGSLTILGVLFFANMTKQRHNTMPLIWVTAASVAASAVALFIFADHSWPMIVMGAVAVVLLISTIIVLRMQFITELRKRFHI